MNSIKKHHLKIFLLQKYIQMKMDGKIKYLIRDDKYFIIFLQTLFIFGKHS